MMLGGPCPDLALAVGSAVMRMLADATGELWLVRVVWEPEPYQTYCYHAASSGQERTQQVTAALLEAVIPLGAVAAEVVRCLVPDAGVQGQSLVYAKTTATLGPPESA